MNVLKIAEIFTSLMLFAIDNHTAVAKYGIAMAGVAPGALFGRTSAGTGRMKQLRLVFRVRADVGLRRHCVS